MGLKTFVHLGRNGDVINTLPLLHYHALQGHAVQLVISAEHAPLLDGVSYVRPLVFDGAFEDLMRGLHFARQHDAHAVNLQVYGKNFPMARRTASFVLEQWNNAGMVKDWGLPLVFDRRDAQREEALLWEVRKGLCADERDLPLVLVAAHGFSSPFPYRAHLLNALRTRLEGTAALVDLSMVRAHRLYDLLGLMDAAACLVTIDTAHAHLAHGSPVPVVALSTSGPTPWHASPRRAGHVFHCSYDAYLEEEDELLAAVSECLP